MEAKKVWQYTELYGECCFSDEDETGHPAIPQPVSPGRWLPESDYQALIAIQEGRLQDAFCSGWNGGMGESALAFDGAIRHAKFKKWLAQRKGTAG